MNDDEKLEIKFDRIIYQFMGWCSVRYVGNAYCAVSEDDKKKVSELKQKLRALLINKDIYWRIHNERAGDKK